MLKKILILIALILYCAPVCAAEIDDLENNIDFLDQYLTLESSESESILKNSSNVLLSEWRKNIRNGNWTEKIDPFPLVEIFTTKQAFNYFVLEYPGEIIYDVGKEIFSLAKLVGAGDISGLVGKFEEASVDKAIEYATQELFKREVRVGFGGIVLNYKTNNGEDTSAQINYIITKKQIINNDKLTKYETVLRFYSPKSVKVHEGKIFSRSSVEFVSKKEIEPFIITIKGNMKYENYNYFWIDKPEVLIDYPKVVPDFGFKKASFFEKKVITPIKEWLKTVNKLFDFFSGSVFDSFSSKTLEKIEENENLKGVSEEIKILEQEIEETLGDAEEGDSSDLIQEKFSEEIDRLNEENEESLIFKENMTDEEIRTLLIAIYNELKKRKEAINELKDDKNEVEDIEEKEIEEKEEKEETKKETEIISYCSYNNQSSLRSNLIINEVAWMGTNNSSSDEWIELKNISNQEIDLNNYQLLNKDNEIKIILKDLKIAPGGYILLERTDDNSVSGIKADLIYKGGLSNSSESIYLFNNNCILEDFVEASPNWPAGDNSNKKSMERKPDLTWKTYSGDSFGTPRAENSQESSVFILPSGGGTSSDPIEETSITYCSQTDLEESLKTPVVINEVAWMGTDISSSDEWIELKNLTDENVSLYGWQLLDKDNNIKIVFEEDDVILANDYYLLERTDDTTISSILADKIYVGALNNTDESLRLFNNTCQLIDEVKADSDWPAGEASKSMERKSDLTWKTYSGDSFGTPRAENSAEISEASSYCLSNGGIIEKRISLGGNYNVCVFDDGKECEEEAMYLGKCPLYGVDTSFYSNDKEKYCVLKGGEVDVMGENLCNFPYMKTCNLDDLFSGKCSDNIYATSLVITEINDGYNKEEREYVTIFNQSGSDISLCSGESCTYLAYFVGDEINSTKWNNPVLNIPLSDLLLENNSSYQIDLNKDNRGDYAPILDPVSSDGYLGISNASICLFNKNVELLSEESAEEAKIDCVGWRRSDEISYNNVKEGSEIYKAGIQFNQALFRAKDSETNKYLDRENNIVDFISSKPTVYTIPDVSNFSFTEIEDKTKLKLSWDFDSSLDASKLSYKIYYTENSSFDEDNLEQILEEDTIKTDNHIETIVSIQQDIDYRFRVITFEEGGNVSDNKNFIFYVSFSSFNDHPYGLFRYNSNKNNKVNYLGPQSGIAKNNLIESDTIFRATPLIDQFGNFYVTQAGESSAYVRVASYDKNGLLRWKIDLSEYFAAGNLILRDSLYYFSKGTMVKFSHSGQKVWEKSLYGVTDPDKYLYYNDNLYFPCNLESKGLCKIDFNSDSFLSLIYNSGGEDISNLLVDEFGNIFFVVGASKLIKLDTSFSKVGEVAIESERNSFINMVNNKILISSQTKETLIDALEMKIIISEDERPALHSVSVTDNGFYIFEATYLGSLSSVSFMNSETGELKLLSDRISRLNFNDCPPVVDIEGNFYYLDLNQFISGYGREGDSVIKILDENIEKILSTDLILLNGEIYFVVDKNLVKASFE